MHRYDARRYNPKRCELLPFWMSVADAWPQAPETADSGPEEAEGPPPPRQSPSPGAAEKYLSNLPSSPLCASASSGESFLRVMFGHSDE